MKTTKLMVSIGDIWATSVIVDLCIEDENVYRFRDNFDVLKSIHKIRDFIKTGKIFKLKALDLLKDLSWCEGIEFELTTGPEVNFWIVTEQNGFTSGYEVADEEEYKAATVALLKELGNV